MDSEKRSIEQTPMEVDEQSKTDFSSENNTNKCKNTEPDSGFIESASVDLNNDKNQHNDVNLNGLKDANEDVKSVKQKNKSRIKISYPDSESDDESVEKAVSKDEDNEEKWENVSKSKFKLFDSDEDEEGDGSKRNDGDTNESKIGDVKLIQNEDKMKKKLLLLCDSESSDDEETQPILNEARSPVFNDNHSALNSTKDERKKLKHGFNGGDDESSSQIKILTAKDALKQRREIQSESQRMTRETDVRLPYHKPKQRTLKEFLAKRTKFSESVDIPLEKKCPSVSIKITNQHLDILSKKMEEREREVEEFFKSDSEHEHDDDDDKSDEDYVPDDADFGKTEAKNEIENKQQENIEESNIEKQSNTDNPDAQTEMCEENCDNVADVDNTKVPEGICNKANIDVCDASIKDTVSAIVARLNENDEEMDFLDLNISDSNKGNATLDPNCGDPKRNDCDVEDPSKNIKTVGFNGEDLNKDKNSPSININYTKNTVSSDYSDKDVDINYEASNVDPNIDKELNFEDSNVDVPKIDKEHENVDESNIDKRLDLNIKTKEQKLLERKQILEDLNVDDPNIDKELENVGDSKIDNELVVNIENPVKIKEQKVVERKKIVEDLNVADANIDKELENVDIDGELDLNIEDPVKIKEQKLLERKRILLERIGNVQPKLSGAPNYLIDLVDNTTKPDEICQLVERFMHHTSKKKAHKNKVQLSIVTVTGTGEIQKEKMSVELEDTKAEPTIVETPGEKLKKLREELEKQMSEQRTKMWEQRMSKRNGEDEEEEKDMDVYEGEKDRCCDGEDKEEVEEGNECDKEESNAMDVDEGVEEDEDADGEEEEDENDGEDEKVEENDEDNEDEESECESAKEEEEEVDEKELLTKSAKKRLKRIIVNEETDSEDEDQTETDKSGNKTASTDSLESQFQPGQKHNEYTPEKNRLSSKPELGFLTPVCNLTGLRSLNSGSKFLHESPKPESFQLPADPSPLKGWQKQLFTEQQSTLITSDDDDDNDNTEQNTQTQLNQSKGKPKELEPELPPTTQDLLDLCSGKFAGFTQQQVLPEKSTQNDFFGNKSDGLLNKSDDLQNKSDDLQNNSDGLLNKSVDLQNKSNCNDQSKSWNTFNNSSSVTGMFQIPKVPDVASSIVDDDDDKLISQILDEEEMEAFKKKFVSPVTKSSQVNGVNNLGIAACINFDSDEDEEEDNMVRVKKRKKTHPAALIDSDDEVNEDVANLDDDNDDEDEDEDGAEAGYEEPDVEYDSEENEIQIDTTAKPKMKINDFFENEAELSESDWGSADEDENNLDEMDIELGDAEDIDQNKVRRDLEKIHMRQVLDEDKREVKILQELLLEDGELHGSGRERQFRWKNIDGNSVKVDENTPQNENDEYLLEDDDNELEWRKKRFEREEFLRKNQIQGGDQSDVIIDNTTNNQVLKLAHKFVLKNKVQVEKKAPEPVVKLQPMQQAIRGSFLARTDKVLSRVAEYTKETTKVGGAATSKKHFVFQTVNIEKNLEVDKKRKASEVGTPQAIKKMRIDNLSPALQRSGNNRLKKLFTNL